jgi:hypothetical protein
VHMCVSECVCVRVCVCVCVPEEASSRPREGLECSIEEEELPRKTATLTIFFFAPPAFSDAPALVLAPPLATPALLHLGRHLPEERRSLSLVLAVNGRLPP